MKVRSITFMIALLAVALLSWAGVASAQNIVGSKHDLTTITGPYTGLTLPAGFYVCQACHSPHKFVGGTPTADTPLSNRDYTGATATYTPYSSSTLDSGTAGVAPDPTGVDLLCLSCHDGTVAVDIFGENDGSATFGGTTRTGSGVAIDALVGALGNGLVGENLSTSHPVSISYNSAFVAQTPTEFRAVDGNGNVTNAGVTAPLFGGEVKCASCHNPHDNTTNAYFLRTSPANLCITCHLK